MTRLSRAGALLAVLLALPVLLPAQGLGVTAAIFRQFLVDYWDWRLGDAPELATHVGVTTYDHRWRDWSADARRRAREARQEFLQRLVYIATGTLSSAERLSADLLMDDLRAGLDAEPWLLLRRVSQHGLPVEVFDVIDQMPARTADDYERILARLHALPVYVDQQIALLREHIAAGRTQPAGVVDRVIERLEAQLAQEAGESPLLAAFRRLPAAIAAADQERLRREAGSAYDGRFVPAWRTLATFLRDTYRPAARSGLGLDALPDGARAYRVLVRAYTGSPLAPDAIHQIGLDEIGRIDREMQRVVREAGFDGSPAAFEEALARRDDMRLAGDEDVLAQARGVLARLRPGVARLVRRLPRADVDVRLMFHGGAAGAVRYTAGTPDGRRPAWIAIDPAHPDSRLLHRLEPLVLHAALPGQHVQTGLAREMSGAPAFRRALDVPVFSNGWALYAESLGTEMAEVYRDPAVRFGQLARQRRHAMALVVDTGIHALGWSRARAEAWMAEQAPAEPAAAATIDRVIALPADALTYTLGDLAIRAERRRVERELGPWFDAAEFHDVVLRQGAVPLDVLAEQVTAYIASARASVQ